MDTETRPIRTIRATARPAPHDGPPAVLLVLNTGADLTDITLTPDDALALAAQLQEAATATP